MPKFAANLSMLFTEVDFLERFEAAAHAKFQAVEYLFPYAYEANVLKDKLDTHQLQQVLFNMYPGLWDKGERGLAALPHRIAEFEQHAEQALAYALALDCPQVHIMSGVKNPHFSEQAHEDTFIRNMRFVADLFAPHHINALIEPLNHFDVPHYFVSRQYDAVSLIQKVDRENVKLQLDYYHAQIMDGDLTRLTKSLWPFVGHIQIASVPNRHEPNAEEFNAGYLFDLLDDLDYKGWVGCEYKPKTTTVAGLDWLNSYL